jgi:hypothetical protein
MEENCCCEFLALGDGRFEGLWDGGDSGSGGRVCDFVAEGVGEGWWEWGCAESGVDAFCGRDAED